VSTSGFTGSGRRHRRDSGQTGRARGAGPRGDGYGSDGRGRAEDRDGGYGQAADQGRRDDSGRGRGYDREASQQRDAYGRGGGDDSERFGLRPRGGYGQDNGREQPYGREQASRREQSYGREQPYGREPGPGREQAYPRGDGYGRGQAPGRDQAYEREPGPGRERAYPRGDGYPRGDADGLDDGYRREDGYGARTAQGSRIASPRRPARYGDTGNRPGNGGRKRGRDGAGRDGRPGKRKGSWWRHWTWKKAIGIALAALGGVIAVVAVLIGVAYADTAIPTDVSALALQQSSTVYFSNGKSVVGTFGTTNRQVLTSSQIPVQLKNAVVAAEDRNFYGEGGISPTGIVRAAWDDITGSGTSLQGGSTITQQFVRNYYAGIGTEQTISRKLKEIFVSVKLARQKSKDWILTQYLNTIYFGDGAYGVGAAAETYFGKAASKLNVAQDAMIAAMLNAPGAFDPTPGSAGYQPLVARWHYVLQGMVTMGKLTQQQAAAQKFPAVVSARPDTASYAGYHGYIMQAVRYELEHTYHYTLPEIETAGLRVVTTFSRPMMNALYATVSQNEKLMAADGKALPRYAHVGAVLEQPGTGAIVAMYSGPSYSEPEKYCQRIACNVDMALENREQVGSSFKPYVLATARAQGMSVKTSVLDGTSPLCVPGDHYPQQYSVPATGPGQAGCPATPYGWHEFSNDAGDSGLGGPQSVVYSTAQSLNTAYTDLTHRVGTQNVINMAKSFGVNTGPYPSVGSGLQNMVGQVGIALGTAALTVEEQANMFATLAADGQYVTPHVIKQITQGTNLVPAKVTHREVLTPDQASDVDYALSFDTTEGTGTNAAMSDGRPVIGKTGTTETAQSAFFLGAIPQYSLTVGMFTNNQNASTSANAQTLNGVGGMAGYGGDWPALIWHSFAEKEFAQLPVENFPAPDLGGTAWNLMGPGQGLAHPKQRRGPSPPPQPPPTPTPSCTHVPLRPACGGGSPPPTSPPPTSPSPSPSCTSGPLRCRTGRPSPPPNPGGTGSRNDASVPVAADRARGPSG
jgi:membrane peptidoglycan carboxypeptidase